ncbi:MAG: uroporphyrinogen decarboxylase [Anaerolineaceae bacterium]|nr:uroporphyrinogen decarboxylase [Anaerolineaceae bacterium]
MNTSVTHRQLLEACLSGNKVSRLPVALWRHFPVDDQSPQSLAAATFAFQQIFDFDLVKVTPASSFCIKDWGSTDTWVGNPEGTRDYGKPVIRNPEDWAKLKPLNPQSGALASQLECLKLLKGALGSTTPVIQTIFSPLSQAKNLAGKNNLVSFLRRSPQALHEGLKTITESTLRFIRACEETGIDGVFYAIQHASVDLLSLSEFSEFGKFYDMQTLEATGKLWLNMAHIHGDNLMFDELTDYPVQILNWHDRHTQPDLRNARQKFNGVLCGGLRRWETMVQGTPVDIENEARDAIDQTGGERFILGTGCVLPIIAPYGNILKARDCASLLES